ncbi:carbohydrate ABC transporter permease [Paenibacillus aurantius]|uniref:Carbohydrate ABC transporter permease n=1 Tax=Paenibacillus aurantius TaxID=2918900 RepID=A0AA96LI22_9BACL|nr:carbohydrate ABC transporter permease [Paenibacillus aurantius]WJH32961.1 carbohydrate ABC transporter permease [Paenibacillus sp. CC-CFT747]WNQ13368.1 carbohydrate ABC transporter permease [Paenibacillus aurantius]
MNTRKSEKSVIFTFSAYTLVTIASLICLIPFLLILSGSLTSNESIIRDGYRLFPKEFSSAAYKAIFAAPSPIVRAYGVTTFVTIVGTAIGLFLMTMAGYVLQRKDFRYRNRCMFFIYFTTLFSGGLVPWYIMMTSYLNLTDTYTALIFPGLMSPFLIILMRSFIRTTIPDEIVESAKIDGANDFRIYYQVVVPLAMPGIATVGLFLALGYWNGWFHSSLFINDPHKYELQYYLYNIINTMSFLADLGASTGVTVAVDIPMESTKLAMALIVTGPILLLYPFVQRFFVKGLTVGAVKG